MKATVGVVFAALQLANGERHRRVVKSTMTKEPIEKYGQLLAVASVLEEALKNCHVEIELPPEADETLLQFSTACVLVRSSEPDAHRMS